ncbi:DUF4403 family protein [Spirosoma sp. KUDC1026]|uniref:DUF4403 family protein n=1 Tax=Spirosoma sp. KUDC1026 TaxID=2745947 RepID=UPI00159B8992|nr:DUF4403 family protein [Spirosoma sp. KUDC1026]QKZ14502.1 DUF4403 family protein [Spirosoma sp. KUDC1026]
MRLLRLRALLVGAGALLVLTQCQQVEPTAPKAEGFDAPIPQDTSYLAGSLTFRLSELQNKINKELDPVLVGKKADGGAGPGLIPFRVERSGPVQIQYVNQQIRFSAPLQLWLGKLFGREDDAPRKPFCELQVNFQSPLSVTADWRLSSHVKFIDYKWVIEPEIRLLGREIPLTGLVQNLLERYQTAIEQAIDNAIHEDLRLDKTVLPVWQDIQNPLLISKEYGLWLIPRPMSVAASDISGNQETITTHLRIAFSTDTRLATEKPTVTKAPLPPLQKCDQITQLADLRVVSSIPYTAINQILAQTLKEPKKMALGLVKINKATVYGNQRDLVVKTEVSGLVDGTLYLRGRPTFDTLTKTLIVQNLDFDTSTDNELNQFSESIIHRGLQRLLGDWLEIPLGDEIAKLPAKISEAYEKGPGKTTDLKMNNFRFVPQRIAIRPDGIQALIRVKAKVDLQVQKL